MPRVRRFSGTVPPLGAVVTYSRPRMLSARVGPLASLVILRELGEERLLQLAGRLDRSTEEVNRCAAEQLRDAAAELRAAANQLRRSSSGDGTTEPSFGGSGAGSDRPPKTVVAREVADRLEVSTSYVTRLCRLRVLSGELVGRTWFIDVQSVADYEAARRPVA